VPQELFQGRFVGRSFKLCFALATLQMNVFERYFPGSRFSDAEVDELFGMQVSKHSLQRIETFRSDIAAAASAEAVRRISLVVGESAHLAKGMLATQAMSMRLAYPYCDKRLRDWIFNDIPDELLIGPGGVNKVLMRKYIAQHFKHLPYVKTKGCFRFDLRGLATQVEAEAAFRPGACFRVADAGTAARRATLAGNPSQSAGQQVFRFQILSARHDLAVAAEPYERNADCRQCCQQCDRRRQCSDMTGNKTAMLKRTSSCKRGRHVVAVGSAIAPANTLAARGRRTSPQRETFRGRPSERLMPRHAPGDFYELRHDVKKNARYGCPTAYSDQRVALSG
jgi:hypothetical protein